MPSLSNTASSPADMVAQLATWLVGTVGWTLVDTISASDKVLVFSDGDTKVPVYCRITASVISDTPGIFPDSAFDNVTFRLYRSWNAETHTGYGEVGRKGRWHLSPSQQTYNTTPEAFWSSAISYQFDNSDYYTATEVPGGVNSLFASANSIVHYNGRMFVSQNGATLASLALSMHKHFTLGAKITNNNASLIHTVDRLTGKEYLWQTIAATVGACWAQYDILENTWTYMADPPWGVHAGNAGQLFAWDGDDYIYLAKSDAAASAFGRYKISANTWESLAPLPNLGTWSTTQTTNGSGKMLYLPASVTGFANDFIYCMDFTNSTTTRKWSRYKVVPGAAGEWQTTDTNPTGLPAWPDGYNTTYQRYIVYDPSIGAKGTIFFAHPLTTSTALSRLHAFDLATGSWGTDAVPPNWRAYDGVFIGTSSHNKPTLVQFDQFGALRLPSSDSTLSFTAVADTGHIKIAATWRPATGTKDVTSFVYCGYYDSYLKTDRFTAAAPIAAGKNVTITTNESVTNKLVVGDSIELFDQTAQVQPQWRTQGIVRGGGEVLRVTEILGANSFKVAAVTQDYSAGVYLGQDIAGAVIGNESFQFGCLRSPKGYQANGMADFYYAHCLLQEFPANGTVLTAKVEHRSCSLLSPFVLLQNAPTLATFGIVGQLRGVTTANPRAAVNTYEILPDGTYLVFNPYLKDRTTDPRLMQMGPVQGV